MKVLPGIVAHNWNLKAAAFGLALLLWGIAQTGSGNAETFSSVPVSVVVGDTAWTVADTPDPTTVELRLSGPTREIIRLVREGPRVVVPIPEVGSADTVVSLRRDWVTLAGGTGVAVESIFPSTIRLSFEPALSRALPVSVRLAGALPDGLAFASSIGLNPSLIRVRGPESRVDVLDSVRLRPLDLAQVRASGLFEVPVDTADLRGLRVSPPVASLGIRVEDRVDRILRNLSVEIDGADGGDVVVEPATLDVTLRGARTLVAAVDPRNLRVTVSADLVDAMVAGEVRRVPVRVEGVPGLVQAIVADELVTVRRAQDVDAAGPVP